MTNFDYLKSEKEFESFVDIAITAEKVFNIDIGTCVFNCRRARKWQPNGCILSIMI